MNYRLLVDDTIPYVPEDIGLSPYILGVSIELGGRGKFGKLARNGTMTVTLNNESGVFYPHNTDSAFYEKLLPNRIIKFYYNDVLTWSGYIEELNIPLSETAPKPKLVCRQFLEDWQTFSLKNPIYTDKALNTLAEDIINDNLLFTPYLESVFIIGTSEYGTGVYSQAPSTVLDNHLSDTSIPYASTGWGKDVNLDEVINDMLDLEVGLGFVKGDGQLFLAPYYYYLTGDVAHTLDLDNDVQKATYATNREIKNNVIAEWNKVSLASGTIDTFKVDVDAGGTITKTIRPTSKTNEEKKYLVDNIAFTCADGTVDFTLVEYSIDSVTVIIDSPTNTLDQEEITITGNYLIEETVEEYSQNNADSISKFRQEYPIRKKNSLIGNLTMAQNYVGQWLGVLADDFTYIETIELVNNVTLKLGDIVVFNSANNYVPTVNKHIVTGVKHEFLPETTTSIYTLYGGDAVNAFVIGSSVYGEGDFYL